MTTGASSAPGRPSGARARGALPSLAATDRSPRPTCGDDLERFWPTRRMNAFDEFCR